MRCIALVLLITSLTASAHGEPMPVNAPSPELVERLRLSPFYKKSTVVLGLPIVSSDKVSDAALREAAFIVSQMLGSRPELAQRIADAGVRMVVMSPLEMTTDIPEHADLTPKAYWNRRARGLGATAERPAISCAEENLLSFPGDPYSEENICVHELAHVVAQFGLANEPGFSARLRELYAAAKRNGTWKNTYAESNVDEYWAEAVQSWFDTNRHDDNQHGAIDTREKLIAADPKMAQLIRDALGDVAWRYQRVARRTSAARADLGDMPSSPPTFVWPASAPPIEERNPPPAAASRPTIIQLSRVTAPLVATPTVSAASVQLTVRNRGQQPIDLVWVNFDGGLTFYQRAEPGQWLEQQTYVGHRWIVKRGNQALGQFVAPLGHGTLTVGP